jgi:hypothetical protein
MLGMSKEIRTRPGSQKTDAKCFINSSIRAYTFQASFSRSILNNEGSKKQAYQRRLNVEKRFIVVNVKESTKC